MFALFINDLGKMPKVFGGTYVSSIQFFELCLRMTSVASSRDCEFLLRSMSRLSADRPKEGVKPVTLSIKCTMASIQIRSRVRAYTVAI